MDETSKVVPDDTSSTNSRSAAILKAERAVLCHPGGIVLRFGGLYTVYVYDFFAQKKTPSRLFLFAQTVHVPHRRCI